MFNFQSTGAGVDSFGMACLMRIGELEKPDAVIFADTQGESPETYQHIEQVQKPLYAEMGIKWITVTRGDLFKDTLLRGNTPRPPFCSWMYKRDVINAYLKQNNLTPARAWIGIGAEEAHRGYKTSAVKWVENHYPLLDAGITRYQLEQIIEASGLPKPIKSGCWFCPWRGKTYWLGLKQRDPDRFKLAVAMESLTQHKIPNGAFTVTELEPQSQIDWDDVGEQCTSGYCEVIS
jgi:hypothetical protein